MELFPKRFSRRHFLALGGVSGLGYMRFAEPHWLGVGRHDVRISPNGDHAPLTILQLSDFHASEHVSLDFIEHSVRLGLQACKPDLVCLTGDFITSTWEDWDRYAEILAPLAQAAPTYAILGNHDGGSWAGSTYGYDDTTLVRALLARIGATLLHNTHSRLERRGWSLNLVGFGDLWAAEMEPAMAFQGLQPADATIALSHNPDTKDVLRPRLWDLLLCGHTHGGQLYLPFIGTPFAPVKDKRYVAGLHRWQDRWLHVTKGVGNLHGMRFNCRPEVSVLTLR